MRLIEKIINEAVENFLISYSVKPDAGIIAAFSGGPDSSVMLSVLAGLKKYNFSLTAAYFNHNLRSTDEIKLELDIIRKTSEKLGVQLVIGEAEKGSILKIANAKGQSIEEAARNARYRFLFEEKEKAGADWIATAHNLNDNTETMLMRFFQNAGTAGLAGIPPVRESIIRPLYYVNREQIEAYIEEKKMVVSLDLTNFEKDYLRNKIRLDIIPSIKKIFPEIDNNMCSLSEKLKAENDFIMNEADKRLVWAFSEGKYRIDASRFYEEDELLRIQTLYTVLNQFGLERINYKALKRALSCETENGKTLLRIRSVEIIRKNDFIYVQRLVNRNKKSYLLYLKSCDRNRFLNKQVVFGQVFIIDDKNRNQKNNDFDTVKIEISGKDSAVIRTYRKGDRIQTEYGTKSLKKIFNEWKVSESDRMILPLVEDSCGIAAVIGAHLGYRNRMASGSINRAKRLNNIMLTYGNLMESNFE